MAAAAWTGGASLSVQYPPAAAATPSACQLQRLLGGVGKLAVSELLDALLRYDVNNSLQPFAAPALNTLRHNVHCFNADN